MQRPTIFALKLDSNDENNGELQTILPEGLKQALCTDDAGQHTPLDSGYVGCSSLRQRLGGACAYMHR